jgi:hypothetical protein
MTLRTIAPAAMRRLGSIGTVIDWTQFVRLDKAPSGHCLFLGRDALLLHGDLPFADGFPFGQNLRRYHW